mmetsp:Transcript_4747/g.5867  ORF Transcript_4747/g.5867 Transcript_4747/m.5867 type:complete len:363 (+) Transcript_4747:96-1184(+)
MPLLRRVLEAGVNGWSDEPTLNLETDFYVAVGVVMAGAASFITCLGLNLQKLSLCAPENANKAPFAQPKWVAGLVCLVVGSIVDFMSFGLAPQSLLAPLAALSLVWNLGMASYLHGESYSKYDLYATFLIFLGTGVSISYASHEEKDYALSELMELWRQPRMAVYGVLVPLVLLFHWGLVRATTRGMIVGRRGKILQMVGYAGFAGTIGGQSLLFAKSAMELIKDAFRGSDAFWHIQTYIIIGLMAGCLLMQITFLNDGLKNFDSLYVIPVYESYWIIAGVLGGLVYFGEMEALDSQQRHMFLLGIAITFTGLFVLTRKDSSLNSNDKGEYIEVTNIEPNEETSSSSTRQRRPNLEKSSSRD